MLRARTAPERLAGRTLFVRVTSSALAHEVSRYAGRSRSGWRELGANVVRAADRVR
jgi:hypothetical protein